MVKNVAATLAVNIIILETNEYLQIQTKPIYAFQLCNHMVFFRDRGLIQYEEYVLLVQ